MAQDEVIGKTTLNISCACNEISGSFSVQSSALPLPIALCHCDTCRDATGLLGVSTVSLPNDTSSFKVRGKLKGYESSTRKTRFFCEQCGAFIYNSTTDGLAGIYTGVLEGYDGIEELKQHDCVSDTKDGGLSIWLPETVAWKGQAHRSEQIQHTSKTQFVYPKSQRSESSPNLPGYCHCGGVQFQITRPNEQSTKLSSPWPDLIVPYHSRSSENMEDIKWWLRENNTKYLAGTCACNSCRIASGFDIQAWAFVPKVNIFQPNGKPVDFSMGTLKQYQSSEGIYREFCSCCGAMVFWHCDERPDLIDVSVGLLHAESGARAESWLDWWTERVSFEEDAQNKVLISSLSTGLKLWGHGKAIVRHKTDP